MLRSGIGVILHLVYQLVAYLQFVVQVRVGDALICQRLVFLFHVHAVSGLVSLAEAQTGSDTGVVALGFLLARDS